MKIYRAVFQDILDHECYECRHVPSHLYASSWYTSLALAEQQLAELKEQRDRLQREHDEWCDFGCCTPVEIESMEVFEQ